MAWKFPWKLSQKISRKISRKICFYEYLSKFNVFLAETAFPENLPEIFPDFPEAFPKDPEEFLEELGAAAIQ